MQHETTSTGPLRLLISGLGRSGWNIHAATARRAPSKYEIVGVCDPDARHREQAAAELTCPTFANETEMLGNIDADAIAICTPNHLHAKHTLDALAAGLHVITEKPFALTLADADAMIDAARQSNRVLAPFQNRRFENHFLKVREICNSGLLGEILQIRMCWHGFTRRWDWQTLRKFGGGALQNNGTHLLDQALALFGEQQPQVFADMRRGLSAGDADDHLKIVLSGEGAPTIDIELTNSCAYAQERWHIMGTAGGLHGTPTELHWRWVDWSAMPTREVDSGPSEGRRYQNEEVEWQSDSWTEDVDAPHPYDLFYENFFHAVRHGAALVVTPESARRYVEIIEAQRPTEASTVQQPHIPQPIGGD